MDKSKQIAKQIAKYKAEIVKLEKKETLLDKPKKLIPLTEKEAAEMAIDSSKEYYVWMVGKNREDDKTYEEKVWIYTEDDYEDGIVSICIEAKDHRFWVAAKINSNKPLEYLEYEDGEVFFYKL